MDVRSRPAAPSIAARALLSALGARNAASVASVLVSGSAHPRSWMARHRGTLAPGRGWDRAGGPGGFAAGRAGGDDSPCPAPSVHRRGVGARGRLARHGQRGLATSRPGRCAAAGNGGRSRNSGFPGWRGLPVTRKRLGGRGLLQAGLRRRNRGHARPALERHRLVHSPQPQPERGRGPALGERHFGQGCLDGGRLLHVIRENRPADPALERHQVVQGPQPGPGRRPGRPERGQRHIRQECLGGGVLLRAALPAGRRGFLAAAGFAPPRGRGSSWSARSGSARQGAGEDERA
jgi:hypothetical protein